MLTKLVLADMQRVFSFAKEHENEFIKTAMKLRNKEVVKAAKQEHKELAAAKARLKEINTIFLKMYEDNALGKLSDEQFFSMASHYEEEKNSLKECIATLEKQESVGDEKNFVQLVKAYTQIEELTYENVHEFIDYILIYELDKENNTRKIEIFYNFVNNGIAI